MPAVPTLGVIETPTRAKNLVIMLSTGTLTPTLAEKIFQGNLCPVDFTVKPGKFFISAKNQEGLWQLRERSDDRFMFLPRPEEVNGRSSEIELLGEGSVKVFCQDNPNRWGQSDFLNNVLKADFLDSYQTSTEKLWGRDVIKILYTNKGGSFSPFTVWLFATPLHLFRIEKNFRSGEFQKDVEEVFQNLDFKI